MNAEEARRDPELRALVEALTRGLGPRLKSVILFGSAARGDHHAHSSDLNVLIVLDSFDPEALELLGPPMRRFMDKGHPSPRLFTPDQIARSADVFPIEFLDIGAHRQVLHGDDPFASLPIERAPLRLQIEREFKEKLMRLREAYAVVHGDSASLKGLLVDSYPSFAALFRGALHVLQRTIPGSNAEVIARFGEATGLDGGPFDEIARLRRGEKPAGDLKGLFGRYHQVLTKAADVIDRLGGGVSR